MNTPLCPECGTPMRLYNRPRGSRTGDSHSLYAKPQYWICPALEAETAPGADGKYRQSQTHSLINELWTAEQIERAAR